MPKWDFRDVSIGIKKIREFLIGREYVFHQRFPPKISPRTIPPPDVPRGPEYKYAGQWYLDRNVLNSVKPPVVAPIAEGVQMGSKPFSEYMSSNGQIQFPSVLPTPGCVWWWDAHCYYKEGKICPCGPPREDPPVLKLPKSLCEQPPPPFVPKPKDPCPEPKRPVPCVCPPRKPPCKLEPCKLEKPPPPPPPPEPCDPCKPPKKC